MLGPLLVVAVLARPQSPAPLALPDRSGVPVRVAWSKDDHEIYVATAATTVRGAPFVAQYTIALDTGRITPVQTAPDWAEEYWGWKSDRTSHAWPDLMIDVATGAETVGPSGGMGTRDSLTSGTTSSPAGAGAVDTAVRSTERDTTFQLLLKGRVIGRSVGEPPNPGLTFGWVPGGDGPVMVFVNSKGRLSTLSKSGREREIKGTDRATLPAVSSSGTRLAYLQQTGGKSWSLLVMELPR